MLTNILNRSFLVRFSLAAALAWVAPASLLQAADLQISPLFTDHMVLQCDKPDAVWGTADPHETVTVAIASQSKSTTADGAGKWLVTLDPLHVSTVPQKLEVHGDKERKLEINDVLIGEVWLCSGQSNMEWALGRSKGGVEAVAASANPNLRLCTIPHNSQMTPQESVTTKWVVSGPDVTKTFSAVAWWFGSKLQKQLNVPVGIINDSYGGTTVQAWISLDTLKNGPWPQDIGTDITISKAAYDARKAKMQPAMDKYLADKAAAIANKTPSPPFPMGWPGDFRGPSVLWNGMVVPLKNLSFRGVLWYQGESNAYVHSADTYKLLLPALIKDWKTLWQQPDLPFIIYQIAPNRKPQTDPNEDSGIAVLQEAQLKTSLATPHTALVVTMDLGEANVHYLNKEPAGERGMKCALAIAYGQKVEYASPVFQSMSVQGNQATIHWSNASGGLVAKDGPPSGFVIAGADKNFVFADAKIDGETVVVSSPKVPAPVAVRYGWADYPKVNIFNAAGFPASPFRTDDWGYKTSALDPTDVLAPVATPTVTPTAGHP